MNKLRKGLTLLFACVLGCAASGRLQAAATTYTLTDLGVDNNVIRPVDGDYKAPQVDDSGSIDIGRGRFDAGAYHFDFSPTAQTGEYTKAGSPSVLLGPPWAMGHAAVSYAGGINASGTAVGFLDPNNDGLGGVRTAFVYHPVDGPSPDVRAPAGLSVIPGAYPGTVAWYALGVNASGMIVGVTAPNGPYNPHGNDFKQGRAMLSDGKTTVDLNTLIAPGSGFRLTSATSINDLGQIAGFAVGPGDGQYHAYLLTPTPEPGALAVALAAFGYLGLASRVGKRWAHDGLRGGSPIGTTPQSIVSLV